MINFAIGILVGIGIVETVRWIVFRRITGQIGCECPCGRPSKFINISLSRGMTWGQSAYRCIYHQNYMDRVMEEGLDVKHAPDVDIRS